MKGCEDLIRMRLEGRIPRLLYVDLDVGPMPGEGHLQIGADEPLHSLDMRPVQGLVVSVSGFSSPRVKAVAEACEEAGAKRVIAHFCERGPEGQVEVIEITDTKGLFNWKQ